MTTTSTEIDDDTVLSDEHVHVLHCIQPIKTAIHNLNNLYDNDVIIINDIFKNEHSVISINCSVVIEHPIYGIIKDYVNIFTLDNFTVIDDCVVVGYELSIDAYHRTYVNPLSAFLFKLFKQKEQLSDQVSAYAYETIQSLGYRQEYGSGLDNRIWFMVGPKMFEQLTENGYAAAKFIRNKNDDTVKQLDGDGYNIYPVLQHILTNVTVLWDNTFKYSMDLYLKQLPQSKMIMQ